MYSINKQLESGHHGVISQVVSPFKKSCKDSLIGLSDSVVVVVGLEE